MTVGSKLAALMTDAPLLADGFWDKALCKGIDPSFFFPTGIPGRYGKNVETMEAENKKACNPCPMKEDCLEYALNTRQDHGIWGGTTPEERRQILKIRRSRERNMV